VRVGCGDSAEVSVLEPVAVAFEGDNVGVVDESVDHGGGDDIVAEHLSPAAELLVGGDDQAGVLVSRRDELEEQVRCFGLEGDVADLVDNQQRIPGEPGQLGLEPAGVVSLSEPIDPLGGGGEQHPVPGLAGSDAQAGREVGLPGSGWAEEDHVLLGGDEVQGAQVQDQVAFQPAGVVEVELLECFAAGEPGGADPPLAAVRVTGGDFTLQSGDQELLMRPGLSPGPLSEPAGAVPQRRGLQRPGQERQVRRHILAAEGCRGWGHDASPERPSVTPRTRS
jgi:hypothetical protein